MILSRTTRIAVLAALPAALTLGVAGPASAADGDAHQIDLKQLSDSGATGTAFLSVEGNELTVKVEAEGMTPNAPHAQHLHGSTEGKDFACPTPDADKNGDGIVSTPEGIPSYGDIMISLTTKGDTSMDSGLAVDRMPKADGDGNLSYERTIEVSDDVAEHIKDLHLVQHGIDVNDNGKYDADAGKSELDPKLPLEATAPANCGMVKGAAIGSMPVGGVETGGEGTGGIESPGLIAAGGVGLVGAAGALVMMRRRTRLDG
ncbi:hypothetical protein RM572_17320 [Streptomyces sp. DSM 42041]|uniref:CHRD domain-containing protein n=1 Tax=Streptomyces hazeniae TaxID=3075538 RepID=A0ABU2NU49_9ACTN|nr:hypothetical protein [Streptomyces sp. DSM 42041]MDT0380516.1 hypothetical protein [Streptomyces sp. DSM 42041]